MGNGYYLGIPDKWQMSVNGKSTYKIHATFVCNVEVRGHRK